MLYCIKVGDDMQEALSQMVHINFILVFLEGMFSFFSPCIFPLIPLYLSYLSGNENKKGTYIIRTIFFVLGISSAFFLLGLSMLWLGNFLNLEQSILQLIGGCIILLFGFFQLDIIHIPWLKQNHNLQDALKWKKTGYFSAFLMGFCFSFAWSPCVGPMLSSVLLLAGTSSSAIVGNLYILIYALGFLIPFLILGFFATHLLEYFRRKPTFFDGVVKLGGIILIVIGGMMMVTAWNKKPSTVEDHYLNRNVEVFEHEFSLKDTKGTTRHLENMKGSVIFLNFLDMECIPCKEEVKDIEKLYRSYGRNQKDVKIYGIVSSPTWKQGEKDVKKFQKEHHLTFPILIDERGKVTANYQVTSYPTTYMVDKNGKIYGKMIGALSYEMMGEMIEQTKKGD